jgi:uncharacterized membrane protein
MTLSRRTLVLICAASVIGNLFMAGFLIVPQFVGPDDRVARLAAIAALGRAPKEVTDLVEADLLADRAPIHAAFMDMRDSRRKVREAMRAEPFDAAALDAAFAELRAKSSTLQETVHRAVARGVAAAPAEARAKIEGRRPDGDKRGR